MALEMVPFAHDSETMVRSAIKHSFSLGMFAEIGVARRDRRMPPLCIVMRFADDETRNRHWSRAGKYLPLLQRKSKGEIAGGKSQRSALSFRVLF